MERLLKNGFVVLSRFDGDGIKINDEAVRYDLIKKAYTDGGLPGVIIDTYGGMQYRVQTEDAIKAEQVFWSIIRFGTSREDYLDLSRENLELNHDLYDE